MSEPYGDLDAPVPKAKGERPNGPQAFKDYTDWLNPMLAGAAGELLIVQDTGAPAAKAIKGDATLGADGTLKLSTQKIQTYRFETGNVVPGEAKQWNLTWPEAFADTNYSIAMTPILTGYNSAHPPTFFLFSKKKTGVTVYMKNNDAEFGNSATCEFTLTHD